MMVPSGSDEPDPSNRTVSGAPPDVTSATATATGGSLARAVPAATAMSVNATSSHPMFPSIFITRSFPAVSTNVTHLTYTLHEYRKPNAHSDCYCVIGAGPQHLYFLQRHNCDFGVKKVTYS
jgi:hypothetical protein